MMNKVVYNGAYWWAYDWSADCPPLLSLNLSLTIRGMQWRLKTKRKCHKHPHSFTPTAASGRLTAPSSPYRTHTGPPTARVMALSSCMWTWYSGTCLHQRHRPSAGRGRHCDFHRRVAIFNIVTHVLNALRGLHATVLREPWLQSNAAFICETNSK